MSNRPRAYNQATSKLRELHREEFDELFENELAALDDWAEARQLRDVEEGRA